jgi:hypothetical protein
VIPGKRASGEKQVLQVLPGLLVPAHLPLPRKSQHRITPE